MFGSTRAFGDDGGAETSDFPIQAVKIVVCRR